MQIRQKTWHARYFRFIQDRVFDGGYENGTNLCHYMRVILLWGTLAFIFVIGAFCMACFILIMSLFVFPFQWLGFLGIGIVWAALAAGIATIYYGGGLLVKNAPKLFTEDSIAVCLYERSKAAKRKVCPLINFQ